MHNSGRPTDGAVRASGVRNGNVLIGTEEDFTTPCQNSGRIVAVDLTDSLGRRAGAELDAGRTRTGWSRWTRFHPFLDTPETANPALGCSAHYFEIRASTLARAGTARACVCSTSATRVTCGRSATTA